MANRFSNSNIDYDLFIGDRNTVYRLSKKKYGDIKTLERDKLVLKLGDTLFTRKDFNDLEFSLSHIGNYEKYKIVLEVESTISGLHYNYVLTRIDIYPNSIALNVTIKDYRNLIRVVKRKLITRVKDPRLKGLILGWIYGIEYSNTGKLHLHWYFFLDGNRYIENKSSRNYDLDFYALSKYIESIIRDFNTDIRYALVNSIDMSELGSRDTLIIINKNDNRKRNCAIKLLAYICKDNINCIEKDIGKRIGKYIKRSKTIMDNSLVLKDEWYLHYKELIDTKDINILKEHVDNKKLHLNEDRVKSVFKLEKDVCDIEGKYLLIPYTISINGSHDTDIKMIDFLSDIYSRVNNNELFKSNYIARCASINCVDNTWVLFLYLYIRPDNDIQGLVEGFNMAIRRMYKKSKLSDGVLSTPNPNDYNESSIVTIDNISLRNKARVEMSTLYSYNDKTSDLIKNNNKIKWYTKSRLSSNGEY